MAGGASRAVVADKEAGPLLHGAGGRWPCGGPTASPGGAATVRPGSVVEKASAVGCVRFVQVGSIGGLSVTLSGEVSGRSALRLDTAAGAGQSVRPLGDTGCRDSYWGVGAIKMTIQEQRTADHDDDVITEVSEEEFREAAYAALDRLGLSYAQLRDMARRRDFNTAQAQSLWVSIGGALDL